MQDGLPDILSPNGLGSLMPVTCNSCRRKKRKCDRILPACGNCRRHGIACELPDIANGSPSSAQSQKRLPKGYVEILESRLQQLTATVAAQQAELEAIIRPNSPSEESVVQPELEATESSENDSTMQRPSTRTRQPESRAAPTRQNDSFLTTESVMSLSRMGESSATGLWTYSTALSMLMQSDGSDPFYTSGTEEVLFDTSSMALGTFSGLLGQVMTASGDRLMELYIDNVHSLYPFLNLSKLRKTLGHCVTTHTLYDSSQEGDSNGDTFELLSLLSVLAIGLQFDSNRNQAKNSMLSSHFIFSAISQLESVLKEGTALQEIQSLLLFTIYSLHSSGIGASWQLIGLAMRQCVSRSYHNPAEDSPKSSTGRRPEQGVRATFWSCYMLERRISWTLDRPTVLENADIFIQLPPSAPDNENDVLRHLIGFYWMTAKYQEETLIDESNTPLLRLRTLSEWYKHCPRHDANNGAGLSDHQSHPSSLNLFDNLYLREIMSITNVASQAALKHMPGQCIAAAAIHIYRMSENPLHGRSTQCLQRSWCDYLETFRAGALLAKCIALRDYDNDLFATEDEPHGVHRPTFNSVTIIHMCLESLREGCVIFSGLRCYKDALQTIVYHIGQLATSSLRIPSLSRSQPIQRPDKSTGIKLSSALDQNLYEQTIKLVSHHEPFHQRQDSRVRSSVPAMMEIFNFESEEERGIYHSLH